MTRETRLRSTARPLLWGALVSFLALLPRAVGAVEPPPWESSPFTADPRAILAAAERDSAGVKEPVALLLTDVRFTFDEAGRVTRTWHRVYRVLTAGAHESWSSIEESWSPWHQERPRLRARVLTPDGASHLLDPATLSESGALPEAPDLFEDRRVLRGPLPAVGPGAVVEEEQTTVDSAPLFDRGTVQTVPLGGLLPVRHALLRIDAPAGMALTWVARLLPQAEPEESRDGGRRRLTFEYRDLPAIPSLEPGLPPDLPRLPSVAFANGASWRAVAARYAEIVDSRIGGADLAALRAAVGPTGSQIERIDRLLAVLHRAVRYTGVELGNASIVPRTPAETLQRHYGDCKDKAALLTALLRAEEIPAFVALLRAGPGHDLEASLPGFGGFDHAIVFVPGAPAIWIDPTVTFARAGELPAGDRGRLALVAAADSTTLLHTPEATAEENREVQTHEFFLAEKGLARVVLTSEFAGAPERALRSLASRADHEAMRKRMEEFLTHSELTRAKDLHALDYPDPADLSHPFRLRLEAQQAARGATDRREAIVGIPLAALVAGLPQELRTERKEGQEARRGDYQFAEPFVEEERYRIVPPPGFAPRPLPPARTRAVGTATLSEEYAAGPDGVVTATLRFHSGKRRLSPQEFEALRTACLEMAQEKPIVLGFDQVGEAHLAAGRVHEALLEFRRLAAAAPAKALPHTRLARGLLAGGMGEAARAEARRAVAIEPGSVEAQETLGWVLEHDALGRRFARGFDRAGALAAYRAARQLDPADESLRSELAFLLEHGKEGRMYEPTADLAGAVEEYRAMPEGKKAEGVIQHLALDLLWLDRPAEAREALRGTKLLQLTVIATAMTDGPEAAVHEAEQREETPAARLEALQGAAGSLMTLRRYPEAAPLLAIAGRSSPNPAALLATADVLKKTRRHEELRITLDQPAGVAKKMLLALFSTAADRGELKALLARSVLQGEKTDPHEWDGVDEATRDALQEEGLPPDVILDLALAQAQVVEEGDDALGHRVNLRLASGVEQKDFTVFVVREGSEYRLVAMEAFAESLGEEALRRLQVKDLKGARQWLDWTQPASSPTGDDPLATPLATLIWHKGDAAGEEEVHCAAAALVVETAKSDLAPLLAGCRDAAKEPLRQAGYDLALAQAHLVHQRLTEALALARRLTAAWPASERAFELEVSLLTRLRRWDELQAVAGRRLERKADDSLALLTLVDVAMRKGNFAELVQLRERMTRAGSLTGRELNQIAWAALVFGKVEEADLDSARRATELTGYKQYASLHTLASLYAETGKTAEAYRVIVQAMDLRHGEPGPDDWYVFGRLAEQYELPEVARGYYEKIEPDGNDAKDPDPASVYQLARRRLAALPKTGHGSDRAAGPSRPLSSKN